MGNENRTLTAIAVTVVALVLLFCWRGAIGTFLVRNDLLDYAQAVRRASIPLAEKERLLDRIEGLEDRLDQGERLGYLRWWRTNSAMRDMLKAGICGDKVRLIERELQRAERRSER